MIKPFKTVFAILALAAIVSGCATERLNIKTENRLTPDKASRIKEDSSTKKEVTGIFGLPMDRITFPDGTEQWYYKDWNLHTLWLEFDPQGVVREMNYD